MFKLSFALSLAAVALAQNEPHFIESVLSKGEQDPYPGTIEMKQIDDLSNMIAL